MLVVSKCHRCRADRALLRRQRVLCTANRLHVHAPYNHAVPPAILDGSHPSEYVFPAPWCVPSSHCVQDVLASTGHIPIVNFRSELLLLLGPLALQASFRYVSLLDVLNTGVVAGLTSAGESSHISRSQRRG